MLLAILTVAWEERRVYLADKITKCYNNIR